MRLLLAGNDVTVIALWLGHEQVSTTNIYLHADMTHKQQAIDRTQPLAAKPLVVAVVSSSGVMRRVLGYAVCRGGRGGGGRR
jgi:hypothetical protein